MEPAEQPPTVSVLKKPIMFDESAGEMRQVIERFELDRGAIKRSFPVAAELSNQARTRYERFLEECEKSLAETNFESLSLDGRIDFVLYANLLRRERHELQLAKTRASETLDLLPFRDEITAYIEETSFGRETQARKSADLLHAWSERIFAQFHKRTEAERKEKKISRTIAFRAAAHADRLAEEVKQWQEFHRGYDPQFTWWTSEPYIRFEKQLREYAIRLRTVTAGVHDDAKTALVGDPIGAESLAHDLELEFIPYTPQELLEIGEREFAWCEAEMKKVAESLSCKTWLEALEHVKGLHEDPGNQPRMIRELAHTAVEFLERRDLLTIPDLAKETWRMEMMTPERQLVNPFFTGGETISVSFPTDRMPHEKKLMSLRGNNRHFAWATVQHELIPGHHLQQFMTSRYRPYRKAFDTPFWLEGWALYWEMLLWDLDFARGAEDRAGMLFWRSHRAARIVFSLKFHLGEMTPEQCVEMLVNRVGHERANAEAEVRRSIQGEYPPLYQAAYMLGGLQLRKLHGELVGEQKMTNREFHDAVLRENSIPIELLRAKLLREPPAKDFRSQWRF